MNTMVGSRGLNTGYYGPGKDGVPLRKRDTQKVWKLRLLMTPPRTKVRGFLERYCKKLYNDMFVTYTYSQEI